MKLTVPSYYGEFHCIAGACRDSCCIGWDIPVDAQTAAQYARVAGDFGERLRRSIDFSELCFVSGADGRCPFLNADGLCDIILTLGEGQLCDICDRHPRYFEWFDDRIEGGLGLSCETAAALVLGTAGFSCCTLEAPERLGTAEDEAPCDVQLDRFVQTARERIIALLLDEALPLEEILAQLAGYAEVLQDCIDFCELEEVPAPGAARPLDMAQALILYAQTEPAGEDDAPALLQGWQACPGALPDCPELRRIGVYFVWRYLRKAVFSGNLYPKLLLAVFGTAVIGEMFRQAAPDFAGKCRLAKDFSRRIEYSEENMQLVYDAYDY